MSDDRVLVTRAQSGDSAAFADLLRKHDAKMRGVAWRLTGSQSAMDDVLQDAYVKAWKGLDGFRGEAAFSSWLYRIVYTTSLDHLKSAKRRQVVPIDGRSDVAIEDPSAGLARSLVVREALATLPADQLAVVALVDGEGASYEDAAQLLGVNPGTIASRLHRGRAALRVRLAAERDGGFTS